MTPTGRRLITNDDLLRIQYVDAPRISADGRRVAYTVTQLDRAHDDMQTWVCHNDMRWRGTLPRWSLDGRQLAFISTSDGDSGEDIHLWQVDAGTTQTLELALPGVSDLCWSPDGRTLSFVSNHTLWVASVGDGRVSRITGDEVVVAQATWSPDGNHIAFVSGDASNASQAICVTALEDKATHTICDAHGSVRALAWSPDGTAIAFVGHDKGIAQGVNFGVWTVPLAGGQARCLTETLDRSIGLVVRSDDVRGMDTPNLCWVNHDDGTRIYFAFAEGGSSHIGWVGLDGSVRVVVSGERACLSFDVAREGDAIAFVAADALNPGEVHVADRNGEHERVGTSINTAWLDELEMSAPQRMFIRADDGQMLDAWMMLPPGVPDENKKRYPLILHIHGGPHYPVGNRFCFEFQRQAAQGYVIVFGNPRGSQGYGENFATCIRRAWGQRDFHDLMQMVDAAQRHSHVDPNRMGVTGVSYGGYMTLWIVGHTHRFRAAVCENGISNLSSNFAGTTGKRFWTWQMGGTPTSQADLYRALSPITFAEDIRTPLLLIHAEQDTNCPIGQSEEMAAALGQSQQEVSLIRIPSEGHLMNLVGKTSSRLIRMSALDTWLARWLCSTSEGNRKLTGRPNMQDVHGTHPSTIKSFQVDPIPSLMPYEFEKETIRAMGGELIVGDCNTEADVLAQAQDAEILLLSWKPILTPSVMSALSNVRLIIRWGVGYDMIDVTAATERGIAVANAPSYATEDVAEHALALLVSCARRVAWFHERMRQGEWTYAMTNPIYRLTGKTLGLIGIGRIGTAVASRARGLGLRVFAHDVALGDDDIRARGAEPRTFEQVLSEADFVSVHVPLRATTKKLIDSAAIARMKRGAYLINTSRGPVVDEVALIAALDSGHLAGAGLDVFEQEPLSADHPLRKVQHVVLTPHMAAYSEESWQALRREVCDTIGDWMREGWSSRVVNPQVRAVLRGRHRGHA